MKRFLLLMPVMIQPYILLFALYSIFINQYIVERFFGGNGLWLLFVIFVTIVISFICTLVYMPLCLAKGWGARQTAFFKPWHLCLTNPYFLCDLHLSFTSEKTQLENILLSVIKPDYRLFQCYFIEPVSVIVVVAYLIHLQFIEKVCFFKKARFCCLEITFFI